MLDDYVQIVSIKLEFYSSWAWTLKLRKVIQIITEKKKTP